MPRTAKAPVERQIGDTSKAKNQIAVDIKMPLAELQAKSILWVPVPMDTKTKHLLADVCAARNADNKPGDHNHKSFAILTEMALTALEAARPELEKEAAVILRKQAEEKTPEQLTSELSKMEAKMKAIMEALAAAKKK